MKIHLDTQQATTALQFCLAVTPKHPWGCRVDAGVDAGVGVCRFTITDMNVTVITRVNSVIGAGGTVVINPRLLADLLASFSGEGIDIEVVDGLMTLTDGHSEASLRVMDTGAFPKVQLLDSPTASVSAEDFANHAALVLTAASDDAQRPTLRSLHLRDVDGGMQLTTTDSYRMARAVLGGAPPITGHESQDLLIPANEISQLLRRLPPGAKTLDISASAISVQFEATDADAGYSLTVAASQVEGKFPNVDALLGPVDTVSELTVSPNDLRAAVSRAMVVARDMDGSSTVLLEMDAGTLAVVGQSREVGHLRTPVGCTYHGPAMTVAFHASYLLDILPRLVGAVTLSFIDPIKPVRLQCPSIADFIYLIMPVKHTTH